jgi:hypothetical protein
MDRRVLSVAVRIALLAVFLAAVWVAWQQLLSYMLNHGVGSLGAPDLLGPLTAGVFLFAVLLPNLSRGARAAGITAGISPFWVILPPMAFVAAFFAVPERGPVSTLLSVVPVTLLVAQVALSGWVMYRHRHWPWVALPVVLIALVWTGRLIYAFAFAVLAAADR